MIEIKHLSNLTSGDSLNAYIRQVNAIPILTLEEENELTERFWKYMDFAAAQRLVLSHLRLVVKIAQSFSSYNLPMQDMISEGNIGLMKAVRKFAPSVGTRLSTYAIWWIRAAIQEYILNSWSMIKSSTKSLKQKLFCKLSQTKNAIAKLSENEEKNIPLSNLQVISLNDDYDGQNALISFIPSEQTCHANDLIESQEKNIQHKALQNAIETLNDREKNILYRRRLKETPDKLSDIAKEYNISQERVRQIEEKTLQKLKKFVVNDAFA